MGLLLTIDWRYTLQACAALVMACAAGCGEAPVVSAYQPPPPDEVVQLPLNTVGQPAAGQPIKLSRGKRIKVRGEVANLPRETNETNLRQAGVTMNLFDERGWETVV
jgi:hypothetical protein